MLQAQIADSTVTLISLDGERSNFVVGTASRAAWMELAAACAPPAPHTPKHSPRTASMQWRRPDGEKIIQARGGCLELITVNGAGTTTAIYESALYHSLFTYIADNIPDEPAVPGIYLLTEEQRLYDGTKHRGINANIAVRVMDGLVVLSEVATCVTSGANWLALLTGGAVLDTPCHGGIRLQIQVRDCAHSTITIQYGGHSTEYSLPLSACLTAFTSAARCNARRHHKWCAATVATIVKEPWLHWRPGQNVRVWKLAKVMFDYLAGASQVVPTGTTTEITNSLHMLCRYISTHVPEESRSDISAYICTCVLAHTVLP